MEKFRSELIDNRFADEVDKKYHAIKEDWKNDKYTKKK